jgi:hypothetical protein
MVPGEFRKSAVFRTKPTRSTSRGHADLADFGVCCPTKMVGQYTDEMAFSRNSSNQRFY